VKQESGAGPWEGEYARKGRLWGGAVHFLPAIPRKGRVLELGCGNGKTSRALLERGCEVVGIDPALTAIGLCRHHAPGETGGEFALADARSLPFTDASFTAVIAFHVIGHLPGEERERCAREAARVLNDGGTLYFSGFSKEDFRAGNGCETEPGTFLRKNGIATHYFTESEVLALFGELVPSGCTTRRWALTVRGKAFPRAEIAAAFTKKP